MRATRTTPAAATALAAVAALVLSACGSGSGGSDTIDKGGPATTASAPSATPTATPSGPPPKIDRALALPAGLTVVFDFGTPADPAQAAALTGAADFIQAISHAVVRQNPHDAVLGAYGAGDALTYARTYVQQNVRRRLTLTGTDRYYRPKITVSKGGGAVEVVLCNNQAKLYSKDIATGKVHITPADDASYSLFDLVMAKLPTGKGLWQANSITVKGKALECEQ
ncbi:hypothetical protein [Actinacidiphila rubida]|uniref:Lipoprotein n=1 Tax=Actinacidiphila rubida TaxID=310780 RepID=A0A1H8H6D4_9ACTN|nr:hypothetical protein [Actinacidiphila rubida]SEN51803.1 hypothetical protein SAMN05216267_100692 [Actinacidiphila rubida]